MAQRGERQKVCKRNHDNWFWDNRGQRRCQTCTNERRERDRRRRGTPERGGAKNWADHGRLGDRGGMDMTYSRSEILKARGYGV